MDELAARGKARDALSAGLKTAAPSLTGSSPTLARGPLASEIEVIMRDFESGLGVFADDGAFA